MRISTEASFRTHSQRCTLLWLFFLYLLSSSSSESETSMPPSLMITRALEKKENLLYYSVTDKQGTENLKGGRREGCWKDGSAWGPDSHYPYDGSQMPLNSSSKGSDPLFQTLWPLYTGLHTSRKHTQKSYIDIHTLSAYDTLCQNRAMQAK